MSRTFKDSRGRGSKEPRRVVARGVKRRPLDYRKLSRALLDLAAAQAEADAARDNPSAPAGMPSVSVGGEIPEPSTSTPMSKPKGSPEEVA